MYMCFYPWPHCHLHTHRGDMIKQIIKQVRDIDISKLSFYSPQGCPWTYTQMQAESWLYTEPSCSTDIRELFWGEKTNTASAFQKVSCHLLKTLVTSCLKIYLKISQGYLFFFWADLLRKLCTPNFWKSLHLKTNTFLNRSSYNTYIA